jgi:SPOR domain
MKFCAALVFGGIIAFFLFPGCSKEESLPPPRQKQKVVRPAGIAAVQKQEVASVPEEKKEAPQEAPQQQKEAVKEEASEKKPPETKKEEPEDKGEPRDRDYIVRNWDSLSSIAGRYEIYKDPLKWIVLFRFNLEALGGLPESPDFAERNLPQGTRLKIVMPRQPMTSGKEPDGLWVANVMSARSNDEIVPLAIRLAKGGFPVYMTRTQVKGQEWVRLRVGFFVSKTEAQEAGRKIKEAFRVEEPWILKVNKEEYEEFAGFLKRESGS